MKQENIIEGRGLRKSYKHFKLDMPELNIPKGFATALIGENGAGKSTLIEMMEGIRSTFNGEFRYFGQFDSHNAKHDPEIKSRIGFLSNTSFYNMGWTISEIIEISKIIFPDFSEDEFRRLCIDTGLAEGSEIDGSKKVMKMSDGSRVKLMLANILARMDTELLILDEPASALDPLMRDKLCEMIREYIASRDGRTVFFSTHNISDMEQITDYAIIMGHGTIAEQGFVEDLKDKYIYVKGDAKDADAAKPYMYSFTSGNYGFEGLCLKENMKSLASLDLVTERPSLFKISVAVMKKHSFIR